MVTNNEAQASIVLIEMVTTFFDWRRVMKKRLIMLVALIYILCLIFGGDGVGKRFLEQKLPELTYSGSKCVHKENDDEHILEDEDTAGSIFTYEELAAMENENASAKNSMMSDTDQLASVDEAVKAAGEAQNISKENKPDMPQVDMSFENLIKNYYQVDKTTYIGADELCESNLLGRDMSIERSADGPDILIYHTHSQEGYCDSSDNSQSATVVGIGDRLSELLTNKYGYKVLHHKGQYDVNDRDHAYSNSLPEITKIINDNPSIKVVIDLHRDGVAETTRLATTIDGKPMAQIMFFNGLCRTAARGAIDSLPNQYLGDNLAFSFQLQLMADEYYPGFARRIYLKGYRYNMHLCPRSLLVEVGAQTNTVEEAYNAMEPLADILDKVLK